MLKNQLEDDSLSSFEKSTSDEVKIIFMPEVLCTQFVTPEQILLHGVIEKVGRKSIIGSSIRHQHIVCEAAFEQKRMTPIIHSHISLGQAPDLFLFTSLQRDMKGSCIISKRKNAGHVKTHPNMFQNCLDKRILVNGEYYEGDQIFV